MKKTPDIYDYLKKDHKKVSAVFKKIIVTKDMQLKTSTKVATLRNSFNALDFLWIFL